MNVSIKKLCLRQNFETPLSKVADIVPCTDGSLNALAFDWITDNIYVASGRGTILACDVRKKRTLSCARVMTGQGDIRDIALDPINGYCHCQLPVMNYCSWVHYRLT